MRFIHLLNESPIVFVPQMERWGWPMSGPGFEAYSPTGEVRAFRTREEAHAWRIAEIRQTLKSEED